MMATVHTLAGILIGLKVGSWKLAFLIAFLSHFILDLIPHWDFFSFRDEITRRDKINAGIDITIGFLIGTASIIRALPNVNQAVVLAGTCAFANLPDALEAPYVFLDNNNWVTKNIMRIQHIFHGRAHLPWGIVTQIGVVILITFLILT